MLLAVFGLGFNVVLAGIIAGDWRPAELAGGAQVVWWIGVALAAGALVAISSAVWPHLDGDQATGRVTYFKHVVAYRSRDALRDAIERQADHPGDRPIEQLETVSRIALSKYQRVRAALLLYGGGVVSCSVAVLVS